MRTALAALSLALVAVVGCGAKYPGDSSSSGGDTGTTAASGSTGVTGGSGGTTGSCVPVDWNTVSALFVTYCTTCHSPTGMASRYVDLTNQSASTADASAIAAYVGAGLMPQNATITAADKQTILDWASNPSGVCSTGSGTGTGGSGSTGTIGPGALGPQAACVAQNWGSAPGVFDGDSNMNPGDNCDQCHTNNPANTGDQGPALNFGGTAYDDATGKALSADATVTVVDANGTTVTRTASVGNNGNFDSRRSSLTSLTPPYTVTITRNGTTLPMLHLAPSGACNSCHQVQANADPACVSANVTPGRIWAP
ncbi:MAG: carboxypeptidase regulatory-like domain-containing protein [Deltaproteobacteria bacterium]|nr:carboxypeptidase regulatory-like domain-containing protein [Deltaproteobacteria bacterium]